MEASQEARPISLCRIACNKCGAPKVSFRYSLANDRAMDIAFLTSSGNGMGFILGLIV
jgi:hypothetical protein